VRPNQLVARPDVSCLKYLICTSGVYFQFFIIFFISFWKIQKLDDIKNKKLKALFYELLAFGAFQLLDLPKGNLK
jgi:hypothetical protein